MLRVRDYYNGKGLGKSEPGARPTFANGVHAWSDGCTADFKCATLILFLSSVTAWTSITIHWNHFCSCHGKTEECDGGGGCLKRSLDTVVIQGGLFFDRALGIVRYCRDKLKWPGEGARDVELGDNPQETTPEAERQFFQTDGTGVWRRLYHHIPARGKGSIVRRIREAASSSPNITLRSDSSTGFPIGMAHRTVTSGFDMVAFCATRSCYSCVECKKGNWSGCLQSKADQRNGVHWLEGMCSHELKEVVIEAKSAQVEQYTSRSCYTQLAGPVYVAAEPGDILAMESQADAEPFWLVCVVQKFDELEEPKSFEGFGGEFRVAAGSKAVEVMKIGLSSSQTTRVFSVDEHKRKFCVPAELLRLRLIEGTHYKEREVRRSHRGRAAAQGAEGGAAVPVYELQDGARNEIAMVCRALDV